MRDASSKIANAVKETAAGLPKAGKTIFGGSVFDAGECNILLYITNITGMNSSVWKKTSEDGRMQEQLQMRRLTK